MCVCVCACFYAFKRVKGVRSYIGMSKILICEIQESELASKTGLAGESREST